MKTLTRILLIPIAVCLMASPVKGAFDAFLKIDGIEGDSTDESHPNEIVVVSFKLGVVQAGLGMVRGGAGAGKAEFKPLVIFKMIDKATPKLFLACATGQHYPSATLVLRKAGEDPHEFFKVVLSDVVISGVNEDADTTDQTGNLVETASLSYTRITWTYIPQSVDGGAGTPITGGFDLKSGKAL